MVAIFSFDYMSGENRELTALEMSRSSKHYFCLVFEEFF